MIRLLPVVEFATGLMAACKKSPDLQSSIETFLSGSGVARDAIEEPLRILLHAYEQEASLTALGREAIRWDVERYLTNLHRLQQEEAANPSIREQPIDAPIVITGMPRSGSTFLHCLLAEDPANHVLRSWQAIYPYPAAGQPPGRDRRIGQVDRQLRSFAMLAPEIRNVHLLWGRSPQECTEITGHVFQSRRFDTTHYIPSYSSWLEQRGHLPAYEFHKRFLQHLQHQEGRRRWVLKSPDHVFALEALRTVYPDVRVVFMHRDPLKVLPSVAQLTEIVRAPFTARIDRSAIGNQVVDDWRDGAQKMVEASRPGWLPSTQVFHLHYREVVSQPLDAIARLYRHFDLPLSESALDRMARWVAAKPNGGYGRNAYSFEKHGLDARELRQLFRSYVDHFDIEAEPIHEPVYTPAEPVLPAGKTGSHGFRATPTDCDSTVA
jgi:hypothetical protein